MSGMVSSICPSADGLRFGRLQSPAASGEWSIQWVLKRNCSLSPRQVLRFYGVLCIVLVAIASVFWLHGVRLVLPFAGLEVLALGVAVLAYAVHAGDTERIRLVRDRLTVEHACGRHTDRVEFRPDRVRVEPRMDDRSLIELSGQGRSIAVGRFVRPELRPQLADELRRALRSVPVAGLAMR